jgi:hypothetical protein
MSLTIDKTHAYVFLGGLYVGNWTNVFSNAVITGLVLYITTPEIFTTERLDKVKEYVWSYIKPSEKHKEIEMTDMTTMKAIEAPSTSFFKLPTTPIPKIEILSSIPGLSPKK